MGSERFNRRNEMMLCVGFLQARTRAGLEQVNEGQRLSMQVVQTPKGREAISVAVLD